MMHGLLCAKLQDKSAWVFVQKSVARCLRACLALLLFLVSFADGREREEYVQLAWSTVMKILVCLILCSVADVAKTLLAKLLSSHFHKRAHFDKMQDALNKVFACIVWQMTHSAFDSRNLQE